MRNLLLVAVGGAGGAVARHLVGLALAGAALRFPWGTLLVNVAGSLALGALVGATPPLHPARLLLGVGVCGGFTTFSTYSVETLALLERGATGRAAAYALASVALGLAAAAAGLWAARAWRGA